MDFISDWVTIKYNDNLKPDLKKIEALKNISTSISAGLFNILLPQ